MTRQPTMPAAASPPPPAPTPGVLTPSPRRASPPRADARLISHDYDLFLGELPTQRRL